MSDLTMDDVVVDETRTQELRSNPDIPKYPTTVATYVTYTVDPASNPGLGLPAAISVTRGVSYISAKFGVNDVEEAEKQNAYRALEVQLREGGYIQ